MTQLKKIILIFSTQRSGSTMVTSDFAQTQILGNPSEYFTEKILPSSKFNNCSLSIEEIKKEINDILVKATTSNGVVSIKIMSDYIIEIAKAIEKTGVQINETDLDKRLINLPRKVYLQRLFVDFFNSLDVNNKFIAFRVYRKNKVKQAISRFVAARTGLYHVWQNDKGELVNHYDRPAGKATPFSLDLEKSYDYNQVSSIIDSIYQEERELDILFENFQISPINLIYEDIVKNTSYLNNVVNEIEYLQKSNSVSDIKRKTIKTASAINADLIQRFSNDGGYNGKIECVFQLQNNILKHIASLPNNIKCFWNKEIIDLKVDTPCLKSSDSSLLIVAGVLISRLKIDSISVYDPKTGNRYHAETNLKSEFFGTVYWGIDASNYSRFRCLIPLNNYCLSNQETYNLELNYSIDESSAIKFAQIDISSFLNLNSPNFVNTN
ncbi:Stf0 family sulfotransferase [Pleurocapsa sp. PCC 7319]|uniref:Stf0 family sulfotransferase n=1 Tax=Pleurocapsa sp. PCC 7319 TaxID=118161 RepID=UPI00034AE304|nr:Stf0 family sulfotransferase [Pleurocapsa sp. PCC 7319]